MTDDADNLDDSSVNDNRHMISHDANMICGHLNKLQAYMNVGGNFSPCYKLSMFIQGCL